MSTLDKLKSKVANLETKTLMDTFVPKTSGWLSRKLIVMLAIVATLVVIGRENQSLIIWSIVILGGVWMLTQVIQDIFNSRDARIIRCEIIRALAKDGLTPEELKRLDETSKE